jgi:tetratricopeptide (TPR) repeat protein/peroxiredoxin
MLNKIFSLIVFLFFFSTISFAQTANVDSIFSAAQDHHSKGAVLIKSGDKKAGLKELYQSASDFRDYRYWLSEKLDSLKNIFEGLLSKEPQSPVYNSQMGNWFISKQRDSVGLAKAKEYFEKAIGTEPDYVLGFMSLASLAQMQGNSDEAIKQYNKAIEIDSSYYQAHLYLAAIYKRAEMIDKASTLWQKIIQADSSSESSTWAMLDIADTKKTFDEKYSILQTALRLTKDLKIAVSQRLLYLLGYDKNAPDSAEILIRKIISGEDGKLREIKQRGLSCIFNIISKNNRGRIPAFAEEIYNEQNPVLLLQIGSFIADSLNNITLGLKYIEKAYEITNPESVYETIMFGKYDLNHLKGTAERHKYGSVALALGEKYYKQKDYDKALKFLLESAPVNEKQKYPQAHYQLGYVYKDLGKKEEAVKWLVKGLVIKNDVKAKETLEKLVRELNADITDESVISKTIEKLLRQERMSNSIPATDFTLSDLNNSKIQLSSLKGKVVVLDFWATWCGPCIGELPKLVKLYEGYSKNPKVVFYNIDVDEQPKIIQEFMTKKGYSFNVLLASGTDVQKQYGVEAIPTKFLIDKKGRIQYKHIGADPKEDVIAQLSKEIDELLELE